MHGSPDIFIRAGTLPGHPIPVEQLSPSERTRYARFLPKQRRRQYAWGRLGRRQLLDEITNGAREKVASSISHSGDVLAVAAAPELTSIGVDLERPRTANLARRVARRLFPDEEASALLGLDEAALRQAFLVAWTAREALAKAAGGGLGTWARRLDTTLLWRGQLESGVLDVPTAAGEQMHVKTWTAPAPAVAAIAWVGPATAQIEVANLEISFPER